MFVAMSGVHSAREYANRLLAGWASDKMAAADSNLGVRRTALHRLSQNLHKVIEQLSGSEMPETAAESPTVAKTSYMEATMSVLMDALGKAVFRGLGDAAEACR